MWAVGLHICMSTKLITIFQPYICGYWVRHSCQKRRIYITQIKESFLISKLHKILAIPTYQKRFPDDCNDGLCCTCIGNHRIRLYLRAKNNLHLVCEPSLQFNCCAYYNTRSDQKLGLTTQMHRIDRPASLWWKTTTLLVVLFSLSHLNANELKRVIWDGLTFERKTKINWNAKKTEN